MNEFVPAGKWVRGFIASDTLNVDTAFALKDGNGNAVTLAKGERFILEEGLVSAGATACKVTIYSDADGSQTYTAGEELFAANLPVNGSVFFPSANGIVFGRTSDGANVGKIRAIASAASVGTVITIVGRIIGS